MKFRTRLLLIFALTITSAVALVTGAVSVMTRRAFEKVDLGRRQALLDQFQRRLAEQGAEVVERVNRAAQSRELSRIAAEAARNDPDFAQFVDQAQATAESLSLDYLDILRADGTIISSKHWPAKFNYKNDWSVAPEDRNAPEAFLATIPTPDGNALALVAVRSVQSDAGSAMATSSGAVAPTVQVLGGKRVDAAFLASLGLAPGMRATLVEASAASPATPGGAMPPVAAPAPSALIAEVRVTHQRAAATIGSDAMVAIPLLHRDKLVGVLLLANSLAEAQSLVHAILWIGLSAGLAGIALGLLVGWWVTQRVTRPVERLAAVARSVAAGNWEGRVDVAATPADEIAELGTAFNRMTEQLIEQRERAIQAERVAAWRELARRLAHELKNPLFPLQISVENMRRAKAEMPAEFDEVFQEGTQLLVTELSNLRAIIGRFSDFAKMPPPQLQSVDVGAAVREAMKLFQTSAGENVQIALDLYPGPLAIHADPEQLGRALRNLALNAMDAMPAGGTLTVRTRPAADGSGARIEVSDSGQGLTEEECSRLFTPYYTTKQHGTGLGLAIVQSVVSDHHGRIWVESAPGQGATFIMEFPSAGSQNV